MATATETKNIITLRGSTEIVTEFFGRLRCEQVRACGKKPVKGWLTYGGSGNYFVEVVSRDLAVLLVSYARIGLNS
eukprot:1196146-Prorocentrum_minimum.AAC.1